MSAVHLLKRLAFSKAYSYDVVNSFEEKKKDEVGMQDNPPKTNFSRYITVNFKFSHPVIIQVAFVHPAA
jgi:hypothetical protein